MKILSLFDHSGAMVKPWRDAGHDVATVDIKPAPRPDHVVGDLLNEKCQDMLMGWGADIIFSFTPCTDLAVSGAPHFASKRLKNPAFQEEAMRMFKVGPAMANTLGVPYMVENPVSVAASMWRKPDYYFDPYEYGGYLPEDDVHPEWPEYVAPRDAYPKKTGLWTGNGFVMPVKKPVTPEEGFSRQHKKLGGKSERTKTIRSLTPRGFAQAVFIANQKDIS